MQFSFALVAAAAFAVVSALPKIGNGPASFVGVQAGKAFNISWIDASGPVTLTLRDSTNMKDVLPIQSGLSGASGSVAWIIPSTLPTDTYAIKIEDSTGPNYSVLFEITGGPAASSGSSGSVTSTGSSASSSATGVSNSTMTSSGSSSSHTGSTHSGTASRTATASSSPTSTSAPPNSNSGASFASPLAFVLLAFAALVTLN